MPVSEFDREVNARRSGDRAPEQWRDPAAGPEMRASPQVEADDARDEGTPEEPGYGHGV